jgi:hypothetical protein
MTGSRLAGWQDRLVEHFTELRGQRDVVETDLPVFALEHGLDLETDLPELQEDVRRVVAGSAPLPRAAGLPLVVYSAEIGYRYQGDEYWPVFEAETPGWKQRGHAQRTFIRRRYEEFARAFGGAVPAGPWASWFKNIAWPITHAILPSDLQRHLARLLHDYRTAFTAELLEDRELLGARLAGRSHDTSARFRVFAENTSLLGLVAASLLVGEDEESPLLLPEVLHRIVRDLSHERQAGAWLRNARRAAVRIRRRGLLPGTASAPGRSQSASADGEQGPPLELKLSLRRATEGWSMYMATPAFGSMVSRFPTLRDELASLRCRLDGYARVQPRGALMYPLGPFALERVPESGTSVLQVEGGSRRLKQILVDHCRMSAGPWLFRVNSPGTASEVRTRAVRPGARHILVTDEDTAVVNGVEIDILTDGVRAWALDIPESIAAPDLERLRELGLGVTAAVSARPAGLTAADWDGDGYACWPAGEDPTIAIRSDRAPTRCIVSTGEELAELAWPAGTSTIFLRAADLSIGRHELEISIIGEPDTTTPLATGRMQIEILEPPDSAFATGAGQGLQVRAHPPRPTLNDVWTLAAAIVSSGPVGEKVRFDLELRTRSGRQVLSRCAFSSSLPVDEDRWRELFKGARGSAHDFSACYHRAEELLIHASNPVLGSSTIMAERPFEALRWHVGSDRDGPFGQLVNHTDSEEVEFEYFDVRQPSVAISPTFDESGRLRTSSGGLVVARADVHTAGVILPPRIEGGLESLARLAVRPQLQTGPRTPNSIHGMIELGRRWTRLARSGTGYAAMLQAQVNNAILARLGGLIGGQRWWEFELEVIDRGLPPIRDLLARAPIARNDESTARQLATAAEHLGRDDVGRRVEAFESLICDGRSSDRDGTAEALLRLASEPGSLRAADPVDAAISSVLETPRAFRLARFYVMATCATSSLDSQNPLEVWPWA